MKPLSLSRVAFGCSGIDMLIARMAERTAQASVKLTTRYCPKRVAELAGGSLYWIIRHQLVARSPLQGFEENDDGRWNICIDPGLILVHPHPRRAHQGWRYLNADDVPGDIGPVGRGDAVLPGSMMAELADIGLI